MWIICRELDNIVIGTIAIEPPEGSYGPGVYFQYWDGPEPQIEIAGEQAGDPDPTLALDKEGLRAMAFIGSDGVSVYELADALDAIVEDLDSVLSLDAKEKAKKVKDKVKEVKDKYP